jgi:hypothetical protein
VRELEYSGGVSRAFVPGPFCTAVKRAHRYEAELNRVTTSPRTTRLKNAQSTLETSSKRLCEPATWIQEREGSPG